MNDLTAHEAQLVSEHQATLLVAVQRFFDRVPISKAIRRAFNDTPRHLFAPRFYSSKQRRWVDLADEPLREHLAELYADHPLCIYRDERGSSLSTISQPSLVLYMLDLLELKPGHSVFELGGGSGWNAALMANLVGKSGKVASVEIIGSLAASAKSGLAKLGLDQVDFRSGDANLGSPLAETFDRGIFTASAWDLPKVFFRQIASDGLLLFVVKAQANYDLLCLLRKTGDDCFQSELHFSCSFVPVTGSSPLPEHRPTQLADSSALTELSWADIKIADAAIPAFIEFAKLVFDCQQTYLAPHEGVDFDEEFWGIKDEQDGSLLVFNEDRLRNYGGESALVRLRRAAKRWQKRNQPEIDDLKLSIYERSAAPEPTNDQWIARRGESALLWSLA